MKRVWRRSLITLALGAAIALVWLAGTESGLRWALARTTPLLPGELSVQEIHGRLIGPIETDGLRFRSDAVDLRIERLRLDWTPAVLLLGRVRVSELYAHHVKLELHSTPSGEKQKGAAAPSLHIADARIEDLSVLRAPDTPALQLDRLEFAARMSRGGLGITRLLVERERQTFAMKGAVTASAKKEFDGHARWTLHSSDFPALEGFSTMNGDMAHLKMAHSVTAPFSARSTMELHDLDKALRWSAQLELDNFRLNRLRTHWPELTLRGNMKADGDLNGLQGQATLKATHGEVDNGTVRLHTQWIWPEIRRGTVHAAWQDISWPLAGKRFASPRGELRIQGTQKNYALRMSTTLVHDTTGPMQIRVDGRGDLRGLHLTRVNMAALGGQTQGQARFAWSPRFTWDAHLSAKDLDPERLRRDWPGRIAVEASANGTQKRMEVTLLRADGALRGRSFTLRSALALDQKELQLHRLDLDAPGTRLRAKGRRRAAASELAWELNAEDLSWLVPSLAGSLTSRGELRGTHAAPQVTAFLDGSGLAFRTNRIDTLRGQIQIGSEDTQTSFTASGVVASGVAVRQMTIDATGLLARHRIRLEAVSAVNRFDLEASGSYADGGWQGILVRAQLATEHHGDWHTEKPAALSVKAGTGRLDSWCWRRTQDSLCMQLQWDPAGLRDTALRGHLLVNARDLAALAALVPQLEQPRGKLDADLRLGGTLTRPHVTGHATLTQARFRVPRLGITVRDVDLRAQSSGNDTLTLTGRARSGEGALEIDGRLGFGKTDGLDAQMRFSGVNVQAANIPELQMLVSPDLTLRVHARAARLEGTVRIPTAQFRPRNTAGATLPSPDVAYVGTESGSAPWKITTKVKVTLGDNVSVSGFNFNGRIAGELLIEEQPQRQSSAKGELQVVGGEYSVYRQTLKVERGRLSYNGGPLDDPWLDVRATRQIDDVLAGVQARGTLKRPQLTLISQPAMSDTDILAYLLLGHPFEETSAAEGQALYRAAAAVELAGGELLAKRIGSMFGLEDVRIEQHRQNQTSLILGKRLSPRLYVGYGIGLFETANSLRMRYQLARHWLLETETGTASGVDLLYTIER